MLTNVFCEICARGRLFSAGGIPRSVRRVTDHKRVKHEAVWENQVQPYSSIYRQSRPVICTAQVTEAPGAFPRTNAASFQITSKYI